MKIVSGNFNGTGAAVFICLGFVPDWVEIRDNTGTNPGVIKWDRDMRVASCEGVRELDDGTQVHATRLAVGAGIQPYEGGDMLTTANQTSVTYGEGVYLGWDYRDFAKYATGFLASGTADCANWTLDTSGNRTGHVDVGISTTYFGVGSKIRIDGKTYDVVAITNDGDATDELTLSRAAPSGLVQAVSGKFSMAPLAVGKVTPAGFKINESTLNANNSVISFKAGVFE